MKKGIIILIIVSGLALTAYFLLTPHESINRLDNQDGSLTQEQKDLVFNQIKQFPNNTQMSLALIRGDSYIFYGVIKQNDTVTEIDNAFSLFEIGSITKVFTAALLADFMLDSTLTPDRPINDDLDFTLNNDIHISYKELANHTSGLPRRPSDLFFSSLKSPLNPYKFYSTDKLEKNLQEKLALNRAGGSAYEYSNLGMGILGYVLCKVAQTDYETLLREKIFIPYGLTHTTSVKDDTGDNLVEGLGPFGTPIPNWDLASLVACGGLVSSTHDLTQFVLAHFDTNNTELALTRESTFVVDSTLEIGLAWHILKDRSRPDWFWHNGGTGGYRSSLVFDAENKTGVIVLTNISMAHRKKKLVDALSFKLLETMLAR